MLKTAVPKPPPREPAARKPVRKRNVKNHKRDFVKHFHSAERVEWVERQPCVMLILCRMDVPRHNHHVISRGAGGTYLDVVPLCERHHNQVHRMGRITFEEAHGIDLQECAEKTQRAWQRHLLQMAG